MLRREIGDKVELRFLQLQHAEDVFRVVDANRTYLRELLPWVDLTQSSSDTREFISKSLKEMEEGSSLVTGIWCADEFAGTLGCHRFDLANRCVSIGYWLAEKWQGRGIITSACRAVIDHLFQDLEMHRVEIRAVIDNYKSRNIAERLGFVYEGALRQAQARHGAWDDMALYSLLRSEWDQRNLSR